MEKKMMNIMLRVMGLLICLNIIVHFGRAMGIFAEPSHYDNGKNNVLCSSPAPSDSCGYSFPKQKEFNPTPNGEEKEKTFR